MSQPLLRATGLTHAFGKRLIIEDVSLEVGRGEIRAVIGPNGAGKTTLFNLLSGAIECRQGTIVFDGVDLTRAPSYRRCRRGIGRTFQINNLFPDATVARNIQIPLLIREGRSWNPLVDAQPLLSAEINELADAVGLRTSLDRRAGELPYGDRRRLELAIALAWRPTLLLLDEPACGVAINDRPALIALIRDVVRQRAMAAVLVEHDMDIVFSVAERITVLHRGRVVAEDTPHSIANNRQVQEIYLGQESVDV